MFRNRMMNAVLLLVTACNSHKPSNRMDEFPKFWVKHESIEYKLSNLSSRFRGDDITGHRFVKLKNGHDAIFFGIGYTEQYDILYDIQSKQWTTLISFHDPSPYRVYEDRDPHRAEDERNYAIAKRKFEADVERIVDPILEHSKQVYYDFPERWLGSPPEAAFFDYRKEGGYASESRKEGGGWWGGEHQSYRNYEQFVGTKTMFFKGKPVFQVADETMNDLTYVLDNFRTVVYMRRSTDSIQFDIMDLTDLWKDEVKADDTKPTLSPASPAGHR